MRGLPLSDMQSAHCLHATLPISHPCLLQVLDECAGVLYREMSVRGTAPGLALVMEGRLKSLQSVYRKMARKKCSVTQVRGGARPRYKTVSEWVMMMDPGPHVNALPVFPS